MTDKYDEAIAYLRKNPHQAWDAWQFCSTHVAGCLFTHAPTACGHQHPEYAALSQDAKDRVDVVSQDRKTSERPPHFSQAMPSDFERFAAWERRIDKELGR